MKWVATMTKEQISQKMTDIRSELNDMAIRRGDLEWEYRSLNAELGRLVLKAYNDTIETTKNLPNR